MIKLKNDYAITSVRGAFTLITLSKGRDKEGNEVETQNYIGYFTTLEQALKAYCDSRLLDLVGNEDMELKEVKQAIEELKEEIKAYD